MVTCPSCKRENADGAFMCAACGQILPDNRASLLKSPTGLLAPSSITFEPRVRNRHIGKLSRNDVAIYVADLEEPLIIPVMRESIMGRFGGLDNASPASIDFAPFNGIDQGVSRRHALLRRLGPDVVILDLDSTNGTWLNGVRLKPHEPVTVRSGDRVLLARMQLQIYLPDQS